MQARHPGHCAVTGRRYPAGTDIKKAPQGWAIADNLTDQALATNPAAVVRLNQSENDYFGDPTGFTGWRTGDVLRAEWWDGATRTGGIVVIVTATRYAGYDDEGDGGYRVRWSATARPATDEEAAPVLAAEADQRALVAAEQARTDAYRALSGRFAADRLVESIPTGWAEKAWLTPPMPRTHVSLDFYAYVYPDGRVLVQRDDADDNRLIVWDLTDEGVIDLVHAAAYRRGHGKRRRGDRGLGGTTERRSMPPSRMSIQEGGHTPPDNPEEKPMCDTKTEGGRRCPSSGSDYRAAKRAAAKSSTQQPVERPLRTVAVTAGNGIEATIDAGSAVFRRHRDAWVLVGRGLKAGDTVTVTKRDGSTVTKRVASVVSTDADGLVTAVPADDRTESPRRTMRTGNPEHVPPATDRTRVDPAPTLGAGSTHSSPMEGPSIQAGTTKNPGRPRDVIPVHLNPIPVRRALSAAIAAAMAALVLAGPLPVAAAASGLTLTARTPTVSVQGDTIAVRYSLLVESNLVDEVVTVAVAPAGEALPSNYLRVNPGASCTPDTVTSPGIWPITCDATAPRPTAPGTYRVLVSLDARYDNGGQVLPLVVEYTVPPTNPTPSLWETRWCADSVRVVREVPGTGRPVVWGKRMRAGKRVVASQRFTHRSGTPGRVSCQQGGSDVYKRVGDTARVNKLVWGTPAGLTGSTRAPRGTRPGVYRYRAVAKAVACKLADGTQIVRCTKRPVVHRTTTYTVTVRRDRYLSWRTANACPACNRPMPTL